MDSRNAELESLREQLDLFLVDRHDELYAVVSGCVRDVLQTEEDDGGRITPRALLIEELGLESIDFLDLTFRLESIYKIKIPRNGILQAARTGLDGAFDVKGVVTEAGLERLRLLLPEADGRIVSGLAVHDIPSLFTVETFVRLVATQLQKMAAAAT